MKTYSVMAVCLALLTLPVMAAPQPKTIPFPRAGHSVDQILIPADSPVSFAAIGKNKDHQDSASFKGRFLLVGIYYYGDNELNDSGGKGSAYQFVPQAYIIPDNRIAAQLPHFVARGGVRPIFISNPEAFTKAAVSEAAQRQVQCRNCGVASAHIAIWVDDFSAGIACDAPDYEVRFLSVYRPVRVAIMPRPERGC